MIYAEVKRLLEMFDKLGGLGFQPEELKKMDANVLYQKKTEEKVATVKKNDGIESFMMRRKFNCPVCFTAFESSHVRSSKTKLVRLETDLKPVYEPVDPLYYDATVCPECGYAALGSSFGSITDKQAEEVKKRITPTFKPKQYPLVYSAGDAIERYQLALLNNVVKKGKDSDKAFICLKLAWIYRDTHNSEREKMMLKNAVAGFVIAYENEGFPVCGMDAATLCYLIGELYRRVGNYEKAAYFISRVLSIKGLNKRLLDRAHDIKELIKEERGTARK